MNRTAIMAVVVMTATCGRAQDGLAMLDALDDPNVNGAMKTAWMQTGGGTTGMEATFRLDGALSGYRIVAAPLSNEFWQQKILIIPGETFALFHVHPNRADPRPSRTDRNIAKKYGLKIYTMHAHGLYEYDPVTAKTTKLRDRLDWLRSPAQRQIASNISR